MMAAYTDIQQALANLDMVAAAADAPRLAGMGGQALEAYAEAMANKTNPYSTQDKWVIRQTMLPLSRLSM